MLAFYGGVVRVIVPDNLKDAVSLACFYEPEINPSYLDLARHYGCAILPTRVARPRDKAKVESAVQVVERQVMAPLRNRTFFSLAEVNAAYQVQLTQLNARPFQKMAGSRLSLYESLDRPALSALPAVPYEFALWKHARVNIDYHIQVDGAFYSVPYQLAGREVEVRRTCPPLTAVTSSGRRRGSSPGGRAWVRPPARSWPASSSAVPTPSRATAPRSDSCAWPANTARRASRRPAPVPSLPEPSRFAASRTSSPGDSTPPPCPPPSRRAR
jgi:transposase